MSDAHREDPSDPRGHRRSRAAANEARTPNTTREILDLMRAAIVGRLPRDVTSMRFPLFFVALVGLSSCDTKPATPQTAAPADAAPPAAGGEDPGAAAGGDVGAIDQFVWADLTTAQKKKHMMDVVVPKLGGVFQRFNGERYGQFDCTSCHGPGAKQGEFAMPSPSLPKLPANGDFGGLFEAKPEVAKFMAEVVVPEMAASLGMQPYNPETHEGFGCYGCHQSM